MNNFQNPYQPPYRFNQTYMNYQTPYQQPIQPAFQQDGTIPARLVSGKEEAVASNVLPGSMFLFYDRGHGMIFAKYLDPQTGMSEFRTYQEVSNPSQETNSAAPEYVTMDLFKSFQTDLERRFEAFQASSKKTGKAVNEDA